MTPVTRTPPQPEVAERIVGSLPRGILVVDRRGRIISVNALTCELLGLTEADLLGVDCSEAIRTDDPNWYSLDPVDRLGDPGTGRLLEAKVGGQKVELMVELSAYGGEDGAEPAGTLILLNKPYHRTDDPENQAERLISLGELSACMAHEIRNPLTGIRTTVQFVGRKLPKDDPKQEDLDAVITEVDRIEKIIDDLLQFSRPQVGNKTMTSLNAILDRTLEALGPQCEEAGVQVVRNFRPRFPESLMDSDMMHQVFFNVITNALEAMPEGGTLKVTSTIRHFRSPPPNLEVYISDTGIGIDAEHMERIFEPFFTTRPAGTGLGLPISLQIIRAHGGRMTARNRARGGVIFRVSMPRVTGSAS